MNKSEIAEIEKAIRQLSDLEDWLDSDDIVPTGEVLDKASPGTPR